MRFITQEWFAVEKSLNSDELPLKDARFSVNSAVLQTLTPCIRMTILNARLSRGWTVKNLADAINVNIESIKKFENGLAFPEATIISLLQEVLGVRLVPL